MIYKALSPLTKSLLSEPETGMGYQLIEAKAPDVNSTQKFIVYNAELIVDFDDQFEKYKRKIVNEGFVRMLSSSDSLDLSLNSVINRQELRSKRFLTDSMIEDKGRSSGGSGSVDNEPVNPNGDDIFVRLSAYANDRRIDFSNKRLLDGSYTTTIDDYLSCKKYNDDPVDRYALPNDEDIEWAFHIQPKSYDKYRPGIVQPANGHSGGGIEALFEQGTSNKTYLKKTPY